MAQTHAQSAREKGEEMTCCQKYRPFFALGMRQMNKFLSGGSFARPGASQEVLHRDS